VPADKKSPGPIKRAIGPGCIAYGLSLIPVRAEVGRHWFDSASRLAAFESVQVVFERSKIGLEQFEGALGILRVCASSFQPRNSGFLLIDKIPRVSWTSSAKPSKPLRISVWPAASQTRAPLGNAIIVAAWASPAP
jgi:hypothetical protein